MSSKMAYVDKTATTRRKAFCKLANNTDFVKTRPSTYHVGRRIGVKAYGQKICYVAPESFTERVMNAIAEVYIIDYDPFEVAKTVLSDSSFLCLFEKDMDIMKETENTEIFGRWISIPQVSCSRETLVNFVTRDRAY